MEFHRGLVNHPVLELGDHGVGDGSQLFQYPFVVALGIELHDEVTALHPGIGGVAIGLQQQPYLRGIVGVLLVLDADIVNQTTDIVSILQVGFDTQITDHSNGKGLVRHAHLEKVGLGEVGTELGLNGMIFGEGGC